MLHGPALAIGVRQRLVKPVVLPGWQDWKHREPKSPCGKCDTQHDRNVNAVIAEFLISDSCEESILPPGRGPMLRDGPALAIPVQGW